LSSCFLASLTLKCFLPQARTWLGALRQEAGKPQPLLYPSSRASSLSSLACSHFSSLVHVSHHNPLTLPSLLSCIRKLSSDPYGIFALVLTPTRELAFQIDEQFR
jgi:hypothetical protein